MRFAFNFATPPLCVCVCVRSVCVCVCVRIENSAALWHLLLYYLHTNYMKSHRISHGRERTQPNAVSATTPWGRPSPLFLSLSLFCPISLLLYHMQILVIFFKCCLLLPCIQFLPGALAACLPFHIFQFSTFALLSSLMIPHTFTHSHTHSVAHTHAHATHYTCIRGFVLLTFSLFFLCDIFFPLFFFARCPTILTACQKEVVLYSMPHCTPPTPLATNPSMPAPLPLLLLLLPSKCLHSKLPMGQWTVCVCVCCCAALPCSHFLLSSFPSSSHLLSNLASWFRFSLFLLHMPIGNADVDSFMPQLIRFDKESSPVYNGRATTT